MMYKQRAAVIINEWLHETEGYGLRIERMCEMLTTADVTYGVMHDWLVAACAQGLMRAAYAEQAEAPTQASEIDAMMSAGLLSTVRTLARSLYGENQTYPCDDVKRMADDIWRRRKASCAEHRSFPDAADGRAMPPMGDELMTAGLSADDARFVAIQLAQNGLTLVTVE